MIFCSVSVPGKSTKYYRLATPLGKQALRSSSLWGWIPDKRWDLSVYLLSGTSFLLHDTAHRVTISVSDWKNKREDNQTVVYCSISRANWISFARQSAPLSTVGLSLNSIRS